MACYRKDFLMLFFIIFFAIDHDAILYIQILFEKILILCTFLLNNIYVLITLGNEHCIVF